jgi:hypothetical protein
MRRFQLCSALVAVGSLMSVSMAQANVTTNTSVPIDVLVTIPCSGDVVHLTGPLHVLLTSTINGAHVSGVAHSQPQGVVGVDLTTGAEYHGTGETVTVFSGSLGNGQLQQTFVNNFNLIGQGSSPNYLVHELVHVTINADSSVTASVDNLSVSCG